MDPRANAVPGGVDTATELTYLRAGADAPWERPHREGVDVTDRSDLQTPYQRQRRAEYDARVQGYRKRRLIRNGHSRGAQSYRRGRWPPR